LKICRRDKSAIYNQKSSIYNLQSTIYNEEMRLEDVKESAL